jgi:ketosteroid isomerase-like protein
MTDAQALLTKVYAAYNRQDFVALAALTTPDVEWPNQMQGGWVKGRDALLDYWRANSANFVADVAPVAYHALPDGRTAVDVNQVVRSIGGSVWSDVCVRQIFTLRDGLVHHMEIVPLPHARRRPGEIGP